MNEYKVKMTRIAKKTLYCNAASVSEAKEKVLKRLVLDGWQDADVEESIICEVMIIPENLAVTRWGQAGPDCTPTPEGVRRAA